MLVPYSSCLSAGIEPPSARGREKDYVALVSEFSHITLVPSTARLRWHTHTHTIVIRHNSLS